MVTNNVDPAGINNYLQVQQRIDRERLKQLELQAPGEPTRAVLQQMLAGSASTCKGGLLVWEQDSPAQELYLPPHDRYDVFFSVGAAEPLPLVQWRDGILDIRSLGPDDVVVAPPYRAMYFRFSAPCRLLHLSLLPEMLAHAVGTPAEGPSTRLRNCFGEQDPIIKNLGLTLRAYLKAPGPKAQEFLDCVGLGVALRLLERYTEKEKTLPARGKLSQTQLKLIDDCLERHQDGRVTLESLAGLVGLSPYHFHRFFKATLGMPPMKYSLQLRMRRARALVEGSRKSIGDIAAEVGCSDQSHFTKMFSKHWGILPSHLRGQ